MVEDLSETLGVLAIWDGDAAHRIRPVLSATRACRRSGCAACCRRISPPRPRPISAPSSSMPRSTRRIASRSACRAAASISSMATPSRTRPTWTSSAASISTRAASSARRWSRASSIAAPRARASCRSSFDGFAPEAGTPVSGRRQGRRHASARRRRAAGSPCCASIASPTRSQPARRSSPAASTLRLVKPAWARFAFPGETKAAE